MASKKDFLSPAGVALPVCTAESGLKPGCVLGFSRLRFLNNAILKYILYDMMMFVYMYMS